jgi:hypothetical protein
MLYPFNPSQAEQDKPQALWRDGLPNKLCKQAITKDGILLVLKSKQPLLDAY